MLSILISTYNHPCLSLVQALHKQAERLMMGGDFTFEIIVSDDASTDEVVVQTNEAINELSHCRYIRQTENRGQSINRNWLVAHSQYTYLLLIDADAEVCSDDFLKNYWVNRHVAPVVCGGVKNPQGKSPLGCELRYKYEHAAEQRRTLDFRREHPAFFLTAFNIFVERKVFEQIRFDERCTEYGYEDALWGLELAQRGICIHHIDNPLIHTGIDSNASFLNKTRTALRVLYRLGEPLQSFAGPARWSRKLQAWNLRKPFLWFFRLVTPLLERHLTSRTPSLTLFQYYKLGYYMQIEHNAG